jgi:hypothetical protein
MKNGGSLDEILAQLPDQVWKECRDYEETILHTVARWGETKAAIALIKAGAYVDDRNQCDHTPAILACINGEPKLLEVLIAAKANVSDCMKHALMNDIDCVKILILNNLRLHRRQCRTVASWSRKRQKQLFRLDSVVRKCRSAVVAILCLHKLGRIHVGCKYAAREIAYAIWATRKDWYRNTK